MTSRFRIKTTEQQIISISPAQCSQLEMFSSHSNMLQLQTLSKYIHYYLYLCLPENTKTNKWKFVMKIRKKKGKKRIVRFEIKNKNKKCMVDDVWCCKRVKWLRLIFNEKNMTDLKWRTLSKFVSCGGFFIIIIVAALSVYLCACMCA